VSDLSLSLSQPLSFSSYFLSPVQLRSGSDRVVLVGTWHLSRPKQNEGKDCPGGGVKSCKVGYWCSKMWSSGISYLSGTRQGLRKEGSKVVRGRMRQ